MKSYDPGAYGEAWADVYDEEHAGLGDVAATVALLADLAGGGRVLEFGVGTGRVALPLAARGVKVWGVDASPAMLARLRAKPGGDALPVVLGDFADTRVDGEFALVFVAFNTLFNLLTQDAQVRCFANAAGHLQPGGRFVVEAFVPDLSRFSDHQRVAAHHVDDASARVAVERHDPVAQRVDSLHLRIGRPGVQVLPLSIRYAWPSELDLMAGLAGLELQHRWGGWDRSAFTAQSRSHLSVYLLRRRGRSEPPAPGRDPGQ